MIRTVTPATFVVAMLTLCTASAQPHNQRRALTPRAPTATTPASSPSRQPSAHPSSTRAAFRFIETKPLNLRFERHILTLTDSAGETRPRSIYPEPHDTGPLATALTPLQFPDPRSDWLPKCLLTPIPTGPESVLSISPGPTLRGSAETRINGVASAR